jgi:hypothetical protein
MTDEEIEKFKENFKENFNKQIAALSSCPLYYTLDKDHNPIATSKILEWAEWFETNFGKRIVKQTYIRKTIKVSTIFLGIDYGFSLTGKHIPLLFETMIFRNGKSDGFQYRYCTWKEAIAGHKKAVAKVKKEKRNEN